MQPTLKQEELEEYRRRNGLCLSCGGKTVVTKTKVNCVLCNKVYDLQDYTGER